MIPGSFGPTTSREVIGDAFAREIEAKARADADIGNYDPPVSQHTTYWDQARDAMKQVIYTEQYRKRLARNERKK